MTTPQDTISTAIGLKTGIWSPIFAIPPSSYMSSLFSNGFNTDWSTAMALNDQFPVFNADPFSSYQAATTLTLLTLVVNNINAETATVSALIQVPLPEADPEYQLLNISIAFSMIFESQRWVIDDFLTTGPFIDGTSTIRAYLRDVAANPAKYQ